MRARLFKLALFCFAMLALLTLFGDKMIPILESFTGDAQAVYSFLLSLFLMCGIVSLAIIFVRTLLGIAMFLIVAVVIIYILRLGIIDLSSISRFFN